MSRYDCMLILTNPCTEESITVCMTVHVVATHNTGETGTCAIVATIVSGATGSDMTKVSVMGEPSVAGLVGDDNCRSTTLGGVVSTMTAELSVVAWVVAACVPVWSSYTIIRPTWPSRSRCATVNDAANEVLS
eukprot:COSAG02_NODE_6833_length_3338_cov_1.939773_1_plen_132_part_10